MDFDVLWYRTALIAAVIIIVTLYWIVIEHGGNVRRLNRTINELIAKGLSSKSLLLDRGKLLNTVIEANQRFEEFDFSLDAHTAAQMVVGNLLLFKTQPKPEVIELMIERACIVAQWLDSPASVELACLEQDTFNRLRNLVGDEHEFQRVMAFDRDSLWHIHRQELSELVASQDQISRADDV